MSTLYQKRDGALRKVISVQSSQEPAEIPIATPARPGLVMPDNETITISEEGVLSMTEPHVDGHVTVALQKPALVSSTESGDEPSPVLFTVSGTPAMEGTQIASFSWSGEGKSGTVNADGNRAVISVEHDRKKGASVGLSVSCTDTWGYVSQSASFSHVVVNSVSRHGEILSDASGNPVAVVTGSYHSNGAEPWDIFGRKVWIAVAIAPKRTNKQVGWYGATIPNADNSIAFVRGQMAGSNTGADGDSNGHYVSKLTTEAHMDAAFPNDRSQDSKRKTDILLQSGWPTDYPPEASQHCRSIVPVINGVSTPMDVPRQSVLMRIYQARELVDALDPTSGTTWKLTTNWGGSNIAVWSSSVHGDLPQLSAWDVHSNGYAISYLTRSSTLGVVPALEIAAE